MEQLNYRDTENELLLVLTDMRSEQKSIIRHDARIYTEQNRCSNRNHRTTIITVALRLNFRKYLDC